METFFALVLTTMVIAFWTSLIKSGPDWADVGMGMLVPTFDHRRSEALLGLMGSIIMPHNFYLHSALVLNRDVDNRTDDDIDQICEFNYLETILSLFVSFIINVGIIALFGY